MTDELPETWDELRLDSRINEAIRAMRWNKPTTVQRACLPQILKGRDVSIQSRTGSGKTAAYCIPLVQMLLTERERSSATAAKAKGKKKAAASEASSTAGFTSLILVPSVELCEQSAETVKAMARYVKPRLVVHNLCEDKAAVEAAATNTADVVVSTPASLAKLLKTGTLSPAVLQTLKMVIIDEADLLISIATTSLRLVQSMLPSTHQTLLLSATLTEGIAAIKGQLLRNPTNIVLEGADDEDESGNKKKTTKRKRKDEDGEEEEEPIVESRVVVKEKHENLLKQTYLIATDECHKHTLLFGLFRLQVIEGKTLIFVDDEQDTYRLQHFLEQLSIATIVYDANLPMNVRMDMLRRFQQGDVQTLICTDGTLERAERENLEMSQGRKRRSTKDVMGESGSALHRGIDFNQVRNVILFDGIDSPSAISFSRYAHRIGRTGRAGQPGTSILMMNLPQAQQLLPPLREHIFGKGEKLRPLKKMDRSKCAKLQYRVDSVLGNVTRTATRRLRVATVASELARSSYLKTHLGSKDNEVLKNIVNKSQKTVKSDGNMLDMPEYMKLGKKVDDAKQYKKRVNAHADSRRQNLFASIIKPKGNDPLRNAMKNAKIAAKDAAVARIKEDRALAKKRTKKEE